MCVYIYIYICIYIYMFLVSNSNNNNNKYYEVIVTLLIIRNVTNINRLVSILAPISASCSSPGASPSCLTLNTHTHTKYT